jgi:hypothetical protein
MRKLIICMTVAAFAALTSLQADDACPMASAGCCKQAKTSAQTKAACPVADKAACPVAKDCPIAKDCPMAQDGCVAKACPTAKTAKTSKSCCGVGKVAKKNTDVKGATHLVQR